MDNTFKIKYNLLAEGLINDKRPTFTFVISPALNKLITSHYSLRLSLMQMLYKRHTVVMVGMVYTDQVYVMAEVIKGLNRVSKKFILTNEEWLNNDINDFIIAELKDAI